MQRFLALILSCIIGSALWGSALTGFELTTTPGGLRFAATDLRQLALVDLAVPDSMVWPT